MFDNNHVFFSSVSPLTGLYCSWIRANDNPSAPLVSVWIDPQMRAFRETTGPDSSTPVNTEERQEIAQRKA